MRGSEPARKAARPSRPHKEVVVPIEGWAAQVPSTIALRARPGGRVLARVSRRTEFGSAQILSIAARKGDWIAVRSPALGNKRLGWVKTRRARPLSRLVTLEGDPLC